MVKMDQIIPGTKLNILKKTPTISNAFDHYGTEVLLVMKDLKVYIYENLGILSLVDLYERIHAQTEFQLVVHSFKGNLDEASVKNWNLG